MICRFSKILLPNRRLKDFLDEQSLINLCEAVEKRAQLNEIAA